MARELLGRYSAHTYAVLRIISGLMFAMHGSQKLFGLPGDGTTVPLATRYGVAGVIELVCGLMIAAGFRTSYAAFLASGQMAFAYFLGHAGRGLLPTLNQGELAVLYCFLFLYMASSGSGIWSVDGGKRR
ncbi:MAG TPA: DoxX family protein [Bryobacteraceae bacterium]|nr:DoxX family protein [Bryobacteraceae bacterium]